MLLFDRSLGEFDKLYGLMVRRVEMGGCAVEIPTELIEELRKAHERQLVEGRKRREEDIVLHLLAKSTPFDQDAALAEEEER